MTKPKTYTVPNKCRQCGKDLPLRTYTSQGGRTKVFCDHQCANKYHGSRRPSRAGAGNYDRGYHLMVTHGITEEDYDMILAMQNGKCAICGGDQIERNGSTAFHIDHSHATGDIRGLLCMICNRQVGWLEKHWDNIMDHLSRVHKV